MIARNWCTRVRGIGAALAIAVAITTPACGDESTDGSGANCSETVQPLKELIVVDPAVIDDSRAHNDVNGPWSFRHLVEEMTAVGRNPSELVYSWLRVWTDQTSFNGSQIDREPRSFEMNRTVICPWLKLSEANACDDTCSKCERWNLDLAKAPFRLIAIVNRMDLRETEVNPLTPGGESRLVFALTDGPADDPASKPRAFTIIFEYAMPESKSVKEWAQAWHALGKHENFDDAYKTELAALTESIVRRDAMPGRPNGSALSQLRTNESTLNWIWQLREFHLASTGALTLAPTKNTPLENLNNSPILASWVVANADAIKKDKYDAPVSLLGGSSNAFLFRWNIPNVDEETRRAFAAGTCSGCHSGETTSVAKDNAFHVSPFSSGKDKLSVFVYDPSGKSKDEVSKRTVLHKQLICN